MANSGNPPKGYKTWDEFYTAMRAQYGDSAPNWIAMLYGKQVADNYQQYQSALATATGNTRQVTATGAVVGTANENAGVNVGAAPGVTTTPTAAPGRGKLNPAWYYNPANGGFDRAPTHAGGGYTFRGQPSPTLNQWGNMLSGNYYNSPWRYTGTGGIDYGLSYQNFQPGSTKGEPGSPQGALNSYGQPLGTPAPSNNRGGMYKPHGFRSLWTKPIPEQTAWNSSMHTKESGMSKSYLRWRQKQVRIRLGGIKPDKGGNGGGAAASGPDWLKAMGNANWRP